jgi:hypothetical protein
MDIYFVTENPTNPEIKANEFIISPCRFTVAAKTT